MARILSLLAVLVALSLLGPGLAVAAQDATPGASPEASDLAYPPDAVVEGLTLGEWVARSAQWFVSFPPDVGPFADETGERCGYGQHGPVFFLEAAPPEAAGPRACVVPAGSPLLVPVLGVGCSTVEPPPFFGRDEAELRACASALVDPALVPMVTVDEAAVPDAARYRVQTPPFRVALQPNNVLGVPPTVATVVFEGYFVLLRPLPPGSHEVRFGVSGPEGSLGEVAYDLTVAEPEVILPTEGTPAAATPTA